MHWLLLFWLLLQSLEVNRPTNDVESRYRSTLDLLREDWVVKSRRTRHLTWHFHTLDGAMRFRQGWKLHISLSVSQASNELLPIASMLRSHNTPFKVPSSATEIVRLNCGLLGGEQVGKVFTIYPDQRTIEHLIDDLRAILPESEGPAIITDFPVVNGPRPALWARYGPFEVRGIVDTHGRYRPALVGKEDLVQVDPRHTGGKPPDWVNDRPTRSSTPLIADVISDAVHSFLTPLCLLSSNPKGDVTLCVSPEHLDPVILKTVRPGTLGDLDGNDSTTRLSNEAKVLEALRADDVAPRLLRSEINGYYIVIQDIPGELLSDLPKLTQLRELPRLANEIHRLHQTGFVHGDIKFSNAISNADRVHLIDFELAAPIGARRTIRGGTRGYFEWFSIEAKPADDVFALGGCLASALLEQDVAFLPDDRVAIAGLIELNYGKQFRAGYDQLTAADWTLRPSAAQAEVLLRSLCSVQAAPEALPTTISPYVSTELTSVLKQFHEAGHWRNEHFQPDFPCTGINVGSSGIVIGLLKLRSTLKTNVYDDLISSTLDRLTQLEPTGIATGLMSGDAGIALALAYGGIQLDNRAYIDKSEAFLRSSANNVATDDFFSGRAGVLYVATLIAQHVHPSFSHIAHRLADELGNRVIEENGILAWPLDTSLDSTNSPFLGAAHGAAGIAGALGFWGTYAVDNECRQLAETAFTRIWEFGQDEDAHSIRRAINSNTPMAQKNEWCHGTTGFLWSMLISEIDPSRLLNPMTWAMNGLASSRRVGNSTMCHGVAGELEVWRMLSKHERFSDLTSLNLPRTLAKLELLEIEAHGFKLAPAEDGFTITPDLWVGFLGSFVQKALFASKSHSTLISLS